MSGVVDFVAGNPLLSLILLGVLLFVIFDLLVSRRKRRAKRVSLEQGLVRSDTPLTTSDVDRDAGHDSEETSEQLLPILPTTVPSGDNGAESNDLAPREENPMGPGHDEPASMDSETGPEQVTVEPRPKRITVNDLVEQSSPEEARAHVLRIVKQRRSPNKRDTAPVNAGEDPEPEETPAEVQNQSQDDSLQDEVYDTSVNAVSESSPEFQALKEKVRNFYVELKAKEEQLAEDRADLEQAKSAFARERLLTSQRDDDSSSVLNALGEQHEVIGREQRELSTERAALRELRAELEGTRSALEDERVQIVRDQANIESLREQLEDLRDEMETAREKLLTDAAEMDLLEKKLLKDRIALEQQVETSRQKLSDLEGREASLLAQQDQMKSREQEIDQREKSATQVVRDLDERQEAASEFEERLSEREAAVSLRDDDLTQRLDDLRRREVLLEEQQDGLNEEQLLAKSREEELSRLANDLQVREQTLEEWKNNVEAQAAELNTARAEFEQTRVVWLQEKESREHELSSAQNAAQQAKHEASILHDELAKERDLLQKTGSSLDNERARLVEARSMTEASHRETAVDRDELAAVKVELQSLRLELEEARERLVNETRRRSEAEEGRRAAKDALTSREGRSAYLDASDPRYARLLDRKWDLWSIGER